MYRFYNTLPSLQRFTQHLFLSQTMDIEKSTIVIDNGSGYIKVGFSGQQKKPLAIPSVIGRPKYNVVIPSTSNQSEVYMGDDITTSKRGMFKLRYPIKHGIIQHWDDMQLLWKHAFSQMKVSPNEHSVLLTEPNMNPTKQRKRVFEIFFEKFQVPAIFVAHQGVLSLFATGKSTGIVLDSGDGVTHVVPVYEGYSIQNACQRIDLGGRDVTEHLRNLMRKSGVNMNTTAEFEVVKQIKEKFCSISNGKQTQNKQNKSLKYILPDGQQIEFLNNEKQAGQILFNPSKIGLEVPSVVKLLANSFAKVDINLRSNLYSEIVLSGGNTMFDGFPQRFVKELKNLLPSEAKPRIFAPSSRNTMCWQGGSILASLPSFKNMWITRKQYQQQKDHNTFSKKLY